MASLDEKVVQEEEGDAYVLHTSQDEKIDQEEVEEEQEEYNPVVHTLLEEGQVSCHPCLQLLLFLYPFLEDSWEHEAVEVSSLSLVPWDLFVDVLFLSFSLEVQMKRVRRKDWVRMGLTCLTCYSFDPDTLDSFLVQTSSIPEEEQVLLEDHNFVHKTSFDPTLDTLTSGHSCQRTCRRNHYTKSHKELPWVESKVVEDTSVADSCILDLDHRDQRKEQRNLSYSGQSYCYSRMKSSSQRSSKKKKMLGCLTGCCCCFLSQDTNWIPLHPFSLLHHSIVSGEESETRDEDPKKNCHSLTN